MHEVTNASSSKAWTAVDQVKYLRDRKGVVFGLVSEDEAVGFLADRNYFFKVKAFCKNYDKYFEKGDRKGRYVSLDFAYLVELSRLDKHLRSIVLDLTLDVEHYLKVRINSSAMRNGADPYRLTEGFLERSSANVLSEQARIVDSEAAAGVFHRVVELLAVRPGDSKEAASRANDALRMLESVTLGRNPDYIMESFASMGSSPYSKGLVSKYAEESVPYWCLMELMSFGSVIKLYRSCFAKGGLIDDAEEQEKLREIKNLLRCSQVLRNAAAHNDCLLNGLSHHGRDGSRTGVRKKLIRDYGFDEASLADVGNVGIAMDLAAVLMCYDSVVPEGQTRLAAAEKLRSACERFSKRREWFSRNYHIDSFLKYADVLFGFFSMRFENC